ncbi:TPA: hypothetical protein HA372_06990 [Candidatus Woesearchaeota archaeon]|nr:hypothetical protein [Candidatus Woesearchaeota archaeon]
MDPSVEAPHASPPFPILSVPTTSIFTWGDAVPIPTLPWAAFTRKAVYPDPPVTRNPPVAPEPLT